MKDSLLIATAQDDTVRIYAAVTTGVVEKAWTLHDTWPTATAALGRLLTGALIMGVMNDNPYRLTVRISSDGPVGDILAVSNCRGRVKGYLSEPHVDLDLNAQGKLDVAGALGKGYLSVTKDLGLKEPYQGIVPLQNGEIAQDLAFYFTKSEQTPSAVALGVLVNPAGSVRVAGGLVVQLMPGASETTAERLETELGRIPSITGVLEAGIAPLALVKRIIGAENDIKVLEELDAAYECDCSRERFTGPLLSLGRPELERLFAEQGEIEVRCHFCNRLYRYQPGELEGVGAGA
jgi:molecular chaperone Hsp33